MSGKSKKAESKMKLYLTMGDVTSEIEINKEVKKISTKEPLSVPLQFQKSIDKTCYFSERIDLVIQALFKEYSTEGDVSYFPYFQSIGMTLEDEEKTLGVIRYKLGSIKNNLWKLQQLRIQEKVTIIMVYQA
ncbi:hypothetical protein [Enterococcus termitis]|uniref:Uncharacterized protein n=1 Tax=Enterococcus termitis TaxID=332950 RepID=A0A1E5GHU3_9ENTE|nr:hypothetical protein [Enterococcus termitis]OEG12303.1 hypothetical protein BCR25_07100 [Enterococcus termitis]